VSFYCVVSWDVDFMKLLVVGDDDAAAAILHLHFKYVNSYNKN
jgi:hypothetical protein